MKNRLILLAITIAFGLAIYGLSQVSRLKITATGGTKDNFTYTLLKQANGKSSSSNSASNILSKITTTGSYEVKVTQGNLSYFAVAKTAGFFQTTKITAMLKPELARTFVGDNPDSCMKLLGSVLMTDDCGGLGSNINTHVPSTPNQAAFVDNNLSPYGHFESNLKTKTGTIALFANQTPVPDDVEAAPPILHTAYTYDPAAATFKPIDQAVLTGLSSGKSYTLQTYKDGFIAYDDTYTNAVYYASIHAKPINITLGQPKTPRLVSHSFSSNDNGDIVVARSIAIEDEEDVKNQDNSKPTEIVISKNGKSTNLTFNTRYSEARFCGTKLCMLNSDNHTLEVNSVSGSKTKLVFAIHNVTNLITDDFGLLAVRKDGLLRINPNTQEGYLEYSFDNYHPCGLKNTVNGTLLCLTNPEGNKVALYINQLAKNSDSIDKKVLAVEAYHNVNTLSIVGNVIYIVPKGTNIFDSINKTNAPDPAIQSKINAGIMESANKAGIDRKVYTIIITQPL